MDKFTSFHKFHQFNSDLMINHHGFDTFLYIIYHELKVVQLSWNV